MGVYFPEDKINSFLPFDNLLIEGRIVFHFSQTVLGVKKNEESNKTLRLFQGPTGVSGPKGARGAQGPPVSDICHAEVLHNHSLLFGLTKP